jgi:hypothetical protein
LSLTQYPLQTGAGLVPELSPSPSGVERTTGESDPAAIVVGADVMGGREDDRRLTSRDYESAFNVLNCAVRLVDLLRRRRDEVELAMDTMADRSEKAIDALKLEAQGWRNKSAVLETKTQVFESRMEALQRRIERAEEQVDAERARAGEAEQRALAAEASQLSLQTTIRNLLGQGSRAQLALSTLTTDLFGRVGMHDRPFPPAEFGPSGLSDSESEVRDDAEVG